MRRPVTAGSGILRAAAVITALLLVPFAASAGAHAPPAADRAAIAQNTDSAPCCMIAATGHRLRCHFAAPDPVVVGPNQPPDDDQPVAAAPAACTPAAQHLSKQSAPATRIPVAVLSRFILFGNFRS